MPLIRVLVLLPCLLRHERPVVTHAKNSERSACIWKHDPKRALYPTAETVLRHDAHTHTLGAWPQSLHVDDGDDLGVLDQVKVSHTNLQQCMETQTEQHNKLP